MFRVNKEIWIVILALLILLLPFLYARAEEELFVPRDIVLMRDVTYAEVDGQELQLDIVMPNNADKDPVPIVVFIHGGGWTHGDKADGIPLLYPLARNGYMCFTVEYRLTGIRNHPQQIHDCKAAIRWIRANAAAHGGDPDRIGVFGMSAGGHLAALLGTSAGSETLEGSLGNPGQASDVQAVCDWYGPANLLTMFETASEEHGQLTTLLKQRNPAVVAMAESASPVSYIDGDEPPFLIIHGSEDRVVPLSQSSELQAALEAAGIESELIVVDGGGHGRELESAGGMHRLMQQMIAFFDGHLKDGE